MITCIDNFLDKNSFLKVQELLISSEFPWFGGCIHGSIDKEMTDQLKDKKLKEKIEKSRCSDLFNYHFIHGFYSNDVPESNYFTSYIQPIYNLLNGKSLLRIKANLMTRTDQPVTSGFHIDVSNKEGKCDERSYTSIFYINTNNGYTEFVDGTKVKSIENRMITFHGSCFHSGVTATDEKTRIVLNFNYFK